MRQRNDDTMEKQPDLSAPGQTLAGDQSHARRKRIQDYWLDKLSGKNRRTPTGRDAAGAPAVLAELEVPVDEAIAGGVRRMTNGLPLAEYTVYLAFFHILLHKYFPDADPVVVSPALKAGPGAAEGVVFHHVPVAAGHSIREVLTAAKLEVQHTMPYADYAYDALVTQASAWGADEAGWFAFGFRYEGVHHDGEARRQPALQVTVATREGNTTLRCTYDRGQLDPGYVRRLVRSYLYLIGYGCGNTAATVKAAQALPAEEREQLLVHFNQTSPLQPRQSVVELVESQVRATPLATALVFNDTSLTYQELNQRANQLAHLLAGKYGVKANTYVAVLLTRSERSVIAMLAVMKAGGCYVPLDYQYPASRLAFILGEVEPRAVLTERAVAGQLPVADGLAVYEDLDLEACPVTDPAPGVQDTDPAYVIYTSGSTGVPKGVVQTYLTLSNLVHWQKSHSGIEAGLRQLQYTSFGFDVSLQDVYFALSGGCLYVAPDALRVDMELLGAYLLHQRIEAVALPFSVLSRFFNQVEAGQLAGHALKHILTSGEQLLISRQLENFLRKNPHVVLHNHYGPSETHVVTTYSLSGAGPGLVSRPPIGKPVSNTRIYILDEERNPVPVGVPGKIFIGGAHLAAGYLRQPELTGQKFTLLSLGDGAPERVYDSGDVGRWLEDGNIAYLGRQDDQLKIRGYRVELGEIEKVLLQDGRVKEVVLMAREDPEGALYLAAYYTGKNPVTAPELQRYLAGRLPEYMIPSLFVQLEAFPLNANGKVDRKALLMQDALDQVRLEAPASDTERRLLGIWQSELGQQEIGVTHNFFSLGGHSLKAVRIMGMITREMGVYVPLQSLFADPTIRAQAQLLEAMQWVQHDRPADSAVETIVL